MSSSRFSWSFEQCQGLCAELHHSCPEAPCPLMPLAAGDSISVEEFGWSSRGVFRRRRREVRYSADFVSLVRGLFPGADFPGGW